MKAATPEAYKLLHDGVIALSQIEANGIKVDLEYLHSAKEKNSKTVRRMTNELREDPVYSTWTRRFGRKTNLGSKKQLATVIFDEMGYKSKGFTATGLDKSDESAFQGIDLPFIANYFKLQKQLKVGTYFDQIDREVCNGYIHNFFNLHTTKTYRSSADHLNFQNLPIRNPEMAELIRRCFIPRHRKRMLVEIDYSGVEVRIAACYHKDPTMFTYILDPTKDMHRDMAAQCYKLKPEDVSKHARYCGKNMFVFPQFYGDYYINCARSMWENIGIMDLQTPKGVSLYNHLKTKGIDKLGACNPKERPKHGTFEHHLKEVENDFWNNRFPVYKRWKESWYKKYRHAGGFETLTGFVIEGLYSKNDVINYPVQGSAFHCLLWSMNKLQKWLRKNNMKTVIVGQIHDSIVADVHPDELEDYLAKAKEIMTEDVVEHWKWIVVPLEVGCEVAPPGASWFEKKEVKL